MSDALYLCLSVVVVFGLGWMVQPTTVARRTIEWAAGPSRRSAVVGLGALLGWRTLRLFLFWTVARSEDHRGDLREVSFDYQS